jgi:hypothetical protein
VKRCLSPLSALAWCLWLILLSGVALAEQPRPLDLYEGDRHYLNPHILLLNDPDGTLTIADILKPEINERFQKPASDWLSFGFTTDHKWLKDYSTVVTPVSMTNQPRSRFLAKCLFRRADGAREAGPESSPPRPRALPDATFDLVRGSCAVHPHPCTVAS